MGTLGGNQGSIQGDALRSCSENGSALSFQRTGEGPKKPREPLQALEVEAWLGGRGDVLRKCPPGITVAGVGGKGMQGAARWHEV